MINVTTLKVQDLGQLIEAPHNEKLKSRTPKNYSRFMNSTLKWTVWKDEKILACCGMTEYWKGRAESWILLDQDIGSAFFGAAKAIKEIMKHCGIKRIEASVHKGFSKGERFVKLLGFKKEADCLKSYFPGGIDAVLYAKVANG